MRPHRDANDTAWRAQRRGALPATRPLQPAAHTADAARSASHTHVCSHAYGHACNISAPLTRSAPPTPPALRARGPRTAAHVLRARGAQAIRSRSQGQLNLCKNLSGACVCLGRPRSSFVSSAASVNAHQTVLRLVSQSRLQMGLERCAFFMSSVT